MDSYENYLLLQDYEFNDNMFTELITNMSTNYNQ